MEKSKSSKDSPRERGFESIEEAFKDFKDPLIDGKELDYYFDSYSRSSIHYEMLNDKVRTECYQNSILKNKHLFQGKVVLDIGCGTGILSMFAATAGAKKVIGIEMARIYKVAEENAKKNGFGDTIVILNGKIEELVLPVDKVDIIISEWMGYYLFFEGMFDSVIFARDKYLKKGGYMFPDQAVVYMAGVSDPNYEGSRRLAWESVAGITFPELDRVTQISPAVERLPKTKISTSTCVLTKFNLEKCTIQDLDFKGKISMKSERKDLMNGLVLWFDTTFSHGLEKIVLNTSPYETLTHWKQGIMYFKTPVPINEDDKIEGEFIMKKNDKNPRNVDMKASIDLVNKAGNFSFTEYFIFG
jgi:protein arginine N-methyltransferase 1